MVRVWKEGGSSLASKILKRLIRKPLFMQLEVKADTVVIRGQRDCRGKRLTLDYLFSCSVVSDPLQPHGL